MPNAAFPRTATVTFTLSVAPDGEAPSGTDLATYLAALLSSSDEREPGGFTLSDPTVFTEPVAVVIDMTDGNLQSAVGEIPMCVIGLDYDASKDDANCTVRNGQDEDRAQARWLNAEARPEWVADLIDRMEGGQADGDAGQETSSLGHHRVEPAMPERNGAGSTIG